MKKILVYLAAAVFLGLLLTLAPSVMITTEKVNTMGRFICSWSEEVKGDYSLDTPKSSMASLEIFAISLIIASFAYVLCKWRMLP